MPETVRDLVITTLTELIELCTFLSGPGSSLWSKHKEGMAECNYCHETAPTVDQIQHYQGSKAGDKVKGVIQLFDEPQCRVITMMSAIDRARKVLDLLKNQE